MLSDKKLEKIEKLLGPDVVSELAGKDAQALNQAIVNAEQRTKKAEEELEANEKYQELKESVKAMSLGFRDVRKFQRAVIAYVLHQLELKGE